MNPSLFFQASILLPVSPNIAHVKGYVGIDEVTSKI